MRYTFGTNETALMRLARISQIFNPFSRDFISKSTDKPVASALDLGCGPGFTTNMLSGAAKAREVYGIDYSEDFLVSAMERFSTCVFIRHDLSVTPFPVRADLMYERFVLAHIQNPSGHLNMWAQELCDGGIILVEEIDDIETDVPAFEKYLSVNKGLVASCGARLYAGEELAKGRYDAQVLYNECVELPVKNSDAASMFYPNTVSIWENEEYVTTTLPASKRRDISRRLFEIMNSSDSKEQILWKMRRIVLRKDEPFSYAEMFI